MAELTKKFHFSKNGTDQQAKLYTTTAEAGSDNTPIKVDGATVYVALGPTSDSRATLGRMKKSNGSTVAVLTAGKPPYNKVSYTTAGTYTWTCPQGITTAKVTVAGGGGGGVMWISFDKSKSDGANGGSGALVTRTVSVNAGQSYSIVVGAGGQGKFYYNSSGAAGNGGASSALGVSAQGGGGASTNNGNGISYGSGGAGGIFNSDGGAGWVYIEYGGDI